MILKKGMQIEIIASATNPGLVGEIFTVQKVKHHGPFYLWWTECVWYPVLKVVLNR